MEDAINYCMDKGYSQLVEYNQNGAVNRKWSFDELGRLMKEEIFMKPSKIEIPYDIRYKGQRPFHQQFSYAYNENGSLATIVHAKNADIDTSYDTYSFLYLDNGAMIETMISKLEGTYEEKSFESTHVLKTYSELKDDLVMETISQWFEDGDHLWTNRTRNSYDGLNRLIKIEEEVEHVGKKELFVIGQMDLFKFNKRTYEYNDAGLLARIKKSYYPGYLNIYRFYYNPETDQVIRIENENKTPEKTTRSSREIMYDEEGKLTQVVIGERKYSYTFFK